MKARVFFLLLFVMAAQKTFAQQQGTEGSPLNTESDLFSSGSLSSGTTQDAQITAPQLFLGKPVRARGPLVGILRPKTWLEVPRRFFQYLNPFASVEPREEVIDRSTGLNTRAWITTVGLRPGSSAFPDPINHESTMSLLTLAR